VNVEAVGRIPWKLRRAYMDSLSEPQELYVEQLVAMGRAYSLGLDGEEVGYGVVADESVVEFYVDDRGIDTMPTLFRTLIANSGATGALCKTFDTRMMAAVACMPARTRTSGYLFRVIRDHGFVGDPDIRPRFGTLTDVDSVLSIHDGFFTDRSEIERYVTDGRMYLYEAASGDLLGCGILTRFVPDLGAVDVGMVVAPAHRRRGVGTHIVAHLKHRCLEVGDRPICGCSADNEASRRALENAGFTTLHSLINFTY
jgi:RimJ/RimL family protein N-acetyltransferase